jgi:hypothetical protein
MNDFKEQYQHSRSGPETVMDNKPRQVVFHNSPEVTVLTNYGLAIQLYGRHNTSKIMYRLNENFNFTSHENSNFTLFKTLIVLKESQEYKDNFLIRGNRQAAGFLRMKFERFKKLKRRGWIRNEAFIKMQNVYRPQTLIDGLLKKIEL